MKRFGGVDAGGIASRSVVEVPSDKIASPGVESPATVAGLSPVNGATMQSNNGPQSGVHGDRYHCARTHTLVEAPPFNPPWTYFA